VCPQAASPHAPAPVAPVAGASTGAGVGGGGAVDDDLEAHVYIHPVRPRSGRCCGASVTVLL
jgi:hypothetical protein